VALPSLQIPPLLKNVNPGCRGLAFTQKQIFDALENVGVYSDQANIGAAIAMAESQGVKNCQHLNSDGSIDRGPFAINSKWHPEVPDSCAYSLSCSAQAAREIAGGGKGGAVKDVDWSPWTTYKSGAYKEYLQNYKTSYPGKSTGQKVASGPVGDAVASVTDPLASLVGTLGILFQASTWFRVGKVLLGAVFLIIVAYQLLR
jgi:hypothetical protein